MAKYRLMKPEDVGIEMASMYAAFRAELIRKGFDEKTALSIAEKVAGAASSNSDGNCGDLARRGEVVINPQP